MATHLSSGRVNLTALREAGRRELREFLDKCAGSKVSGVAVGRGVEPVGRGSAPLCPSAGHRVGRVPDRAVRADRAVLAAQGESFNHDWFPKWRQRLQLTLCLPAGA